MTAFTYIKVYAHQRKSIKMAFLFFVGVTAVTLIAIASLQIVYRQAEVNQTQPLLWGEASRYQYLEKFDALTSGKIPVNVQDRLYIWKLYLDGIGENLKTALLGHPAPLPREVRTSAHNWYIDIAYNFGLISILPVILLIGYTSYFLWKAKYSLPSETLWLASIVFYLVVVDNNFKVSLRQPYPGIFAYFLWGMLLTKLTVKRAEGITAS